MPSSSSTDSCFNACTDSGVAHAACANVIPPSHARLLPFIGRPSQAVFPFCHVSADSGRADFISTGDPEDAESGIKLPVRVGRVWRNARVATLAPAAEGLGLVDDGLVAASDGRIVYAGAAAQAPAFEALETVD